MINLPYFKKRDVMKPQNIYWDIKQLLSYNRLINIAIGSRGCGKTFGCKKWAINDFIKNGNQFIYLRRTQVEIDDAKDTLFRDIIKEGLFPNHDFKIIGNTYFIDDKEAGYAMGLSTVGKTRSISYPSVNKIIYDEFLIDKSSKTGYLRNEPDKLLSLYETVDRGKDTTKIVMIANAMSLINPFFLKWGIKVTKEAKFIKTGEEIVTEIVVNQAYLDWKKQTRFGKFIGETDAGRHMIDNQFVSDNYTFVEKISGHMRYCFTCNYDGLSVGVWYLPDKDLYYCSSNVQSSFYNFAFTTVDHKPNTMMFKSATKNRMVKNLMSSYDYGLVRYENLAIKNAMLELFDYI